MCPDTISSCGQMYSIPEGVTDGVIDGVGVLEAVIEGVGLGHAVPVGVLVGV